MAHPDRVAGLGLIEAHFGVEGWGDRMASMLHRTSAVAREGLALEPVFRVTRKVPDEAIPALRSVGLDDFEVEFIKHWIENSPMRKVLKMGHNAQALLDGTTIIADLQAEQPVPEADLAAITCPTLICYGEHSDIIDRAHDLARLLPNAELSIIMGSDHSVLMSGPEELRARILPWLARIRAEVVVPAGGAAVGF
jgi:pimeloyl-ACP methyl ester carboxylesterase